MDTLQSRLDAEFLLAHMCSVKFKEWIVVLATLLHRAEVNFCLFFSYLLLVIFFLGGGGMEQGYGVGVLSVFIVWRLW